MNLEKELLKYIETFKKKNNGKNEIFNNYISLYLIGINLMKKKKNVKKLIKKFDLKDPFYIDKIILYDTKKNKTEKDLIKYLIDIFYEKDYLIIYQDKLNDIKKNKKSIKIKILDKNFNNNIINLEENINKLNYENYNIELFTKMLLNIKKKNIFDSDLDRLIESNLLIPITLDFNRFHKSSYKTEMDKKKARANIINEKINNVIEENLFLKKKDNKFIDINNYYSILYNKLEEINILNRFLTEDGYFIKNIENREAYIELKKNHDKKYFNFKYNNFIYNTNRKIISIRKSINNQYDKLEIRNIKANENIDIVGFFLGENILRLFKEKGEKNIEKISFFNKNLKSVFNSKKIFIYLNDNKTDINYINIFNTILTFCKKYVLKKKLEKNYPKLFSEIEKNYFLIEELNHNKKSNNKNLKIDIKNIKKKHEKKKINNKIDCKYKKIVLDKDEIKNKIKNKNSDLKESSAKKICIHLIELKEKNDYLYIINKYGKFQNDLFICKYCNGIIFENVVINNNEDYKEINIENVYDKYPNYEEDLIEIETIILKLVKILKINLLNDKYKKNLFLNKFLILIQNHNNLNLYKININDNILINKDINQKLIVLIYLVILFLFELSKTDINNFYNIDNICNYNNFKKNKSFFKNFYINKYNLFDYDILSYAIFSVCCVIIKYILNVSEKNVFNKNIKLLIIIFVKIIDSIIKSNDKVYYKYKNIFLYKLNSLYKYTLKEKKKKIITSNTTKFIYEKRINKIKNIFYNKVYKKNKNKIIFDIKKEKNLKIKKKNLKEKKKKEKNNFLENNKYIPKYTLSYNKFIEKYKLLEDNIFYIDFNLNGYKMDKKIFIENDKVMILNYKNEEYIAIYNSSLKIYMYFDKYYLFYVGYSITKNISNIELYKNENVYLKIKFSLKNKLKYLGYTNVYYHTMVDNMIYENVNKNINDIIKKLHIYLKLLKNNIVIKEPKYNFEKSINNLIKNNKLKIYYENEFDISFNIYIKKINNLDKPKKNIIFIRDIYENNLHATMNLQYFYYLLDFIISKNKNLKDIIFEFINEQFDIYFINNISNEYKNKYKIHFDFYEDYIILNDSNETEKNDMIEENTNIFNYDELDIEENPFDED